MDIGATIDLATQPLIEQIEAQQQEIELLREDNTKLKKENKALLGVIAIQTIIKDLENGNRKEQRTK